MKSSMKKKTLCYLLCFIIPIAAFNLCLFFNDMVPWGNYLITIYDSKTQYQAFFYGLKNFNLFSFNLGLGFNYFGTFFYYLANPLNLLINFFDITQYNTFYYIILSLKFGFCSLSMYYLLESINKNNKWNILFSLIYAGIGYIVTYYYNTFWIDGCYMLPLVLKGINDIVESKSFNFYIISFVIAVYLCFYTAYMIGIFSIIYFIYKLIEKNAYKNKKIIKNFIIATILVILISCIVLLPTFYALLSSKASGYTDGYTKYFVFNSNIKYLVYTFMPGNYDSSQVAYGFGQNYCTLFVVSQVILSFFNKKISKKLKIASLIIIGYYMLSYSFNLIDYSWEFFQMPIWWQHRYSFTFSMFLILIAYNNVINLKSCNPSTLIRIIIWFIFSCILTLSFILFYTSTDNLEKFRILILILSIFLLINYIVLFDSWRTKYKYVVITFIGFELLLNFYASVKENNNKSSLEFDTVTKNFIMETISFMNEYDDSFYRAEKESSYTSNDGLLFGYNGINYFNSLRNQNVVNYLGDYLDFHIDSNCSVLLKTFDPFVLSLLNIKYIISNSSIHYYSQLSNGLYQNPYSLSLMYLVSNNYDITTNNLGDGEFYNNIENIYSSMINEEIDIYKELTNYQLTYENVYFDENDLSYKRIDEEEDGYLSIEFEAEDNMFIIPQYEYIKSYGTIYVNDEEVQYNGSYLYALKNDKIKYVINIKTSENSSNLTNIYYFTETTLDYIMNKLSNYNNFNEVYVNEEHLIETKITVKDEDYAYLYTSIPYEEDMVIKVNGKVVEPDKIYNTFIGLQLEETDNIITIDYTPKGIISGAILSAIGIIITISINVYCRKKNKSNLLTKK